MVRRETEGPPTLLERAAVAAGAGACGAAIAAAGSYACVYGLTHQVFPLLGRSLTSGAAMSFAILSFLLLALAMSVGGGALLSKALGVSTWPRSTLISVVGHAIGIALWITAWNYLTASPERYDVFREQPLRSYLAAAYAFVVPLVVVFSSYRQDAPGGLVVADLAINSGFCRVPGE